MRAVDRTSRTDAKFWWITPHMYKPVALAETRPARSSRLIINLIMLTEHKFNSHRRHAALRILVLTIKVSVRGRIADPLQRHPHVIHCYTLSAIFSEHWHTAVGLVTICLGLSFQSLSFCGMLGIQAILITLLLSHPCFHQSLHSLPINPRLQ